MILQIALPVDVSCVLGLIVKKKKKKKKDYIDVSPGKDGGVLKKVLKPGDGEQPPATEQGSIEVSVHYTGWLLDGTKFDSSRDKGELFSFKLGASEVIRGWDIGVATMRTGEKARFRLRHDFAYGEAGSGPSIPPKATLVFDVELFSFKRVEKKKWELSKEEKLQGSEKEKAAGNTEFAAGNFEAALVHYKESLDFLGYFYSDEEKKLSNPIKVSTKSKKKKREPFN